MNAAARAWELLLGSFLVVLVGCMSGDLDQTPSSRPISHTIEIRDMAFHPADLRVQVGDTIVWRNQDFVPHTATARDSEWSSPSLAQDESWKMVALRPGSEEYLCEFHPVMTATLTVHDREPQGGSP